MGVGNVVTRVPRKQRRVYSGEFQVNGGAIVANSTKFKGEVTVTRNSAGLFTFTVVDGKQARLAVWDSSVVALATTTDGGWTITLNADAMASAGTFQLRYAQQSYAVADPTNNLVIKVEFITEGEVA